MSWLWNKEKPLTEEEERDRVAKELKNQEQSYMNFENLTEKERDDAEKQYDKKFISKNPELFKTPGQHNAEAATTVMIEAAKSGVDYLLSSGKKDYTINLTNNDETINTITRILEENFYNNADPKSPQPWENYLYNLLPYTIVGNTQLLQNESLKNDIIINSKNCAYFFLIFYLGKTISTLDWKDQDYKNLINYKKYTFVLDNNPNISLHNYLRPPIRNGDGTLLEKTFNEMRDGCVKEHNLTKYGSTVKDVLVAVGKLIGCNIIIDGDDKQQSYLKTATSGIGKMFGYGGYSKSRKSKKSKRKPRKNKKSKKTKKRKTKKTKRRKSKK